MRNKISILFSGAAMIALFSVLLYSCQKDDAMKTPPQASLFIGTTGNYTIATPTTIFKIPIGLTAPSDGKRVVNITTASSTGAAEGTHYTLSSKSITFANGKAQDTIIVTGIQSEYMTGRQDVVTLTIADDGSFPSKLNKTFTLNIQGPCYDGNVSNLAVMSGTYAKSSDPDEPLYTATVSGLTSNAAAKTGTAQIANLWNWFNPVTINFDWNNPDNTIVSIPLQETGRNYAAGQPFMIRTSPGQPNTFSVCDQEIRLIVDIIVWNYPSAGQGAFYSQNYPMTIAR